MRTPTNRPELTLAQQRDHFRGRCALALQACSKITNNLANAIRISPMDGCVDVGAIDACREQIAKLTQYLDAAQESALDVRALEAAHESWVPADAPQATTDIDPLARWLCDRMQERRLARINEPVPEHSVPFEQLPEEDQRNWRDLAVSCLEFAQTSVIPFDHESSEANLDALERRARITEPMRRVAARALGEQALVHRCIRGRCPRCREIADAVLDAALNAPIEEAP